MKGGGTDPGAARPAPSIRARLASALLLWALLWGVAVGAAIWLAVAHEVDELLDDTLESSAQMLAGVDVRADDDWAPAPVAAGTAAPLDRVAWQVVAADGRLLLRSPAAPPLAWHGRPTLGFSSATGWRLYGMYLGNDGRVLYVAQSRGERREARMEVALGAVAAALAVGLLGFLWLRARMTLELQPLQALAERLRQWQPEASGHPGPVLGPAARAELEPVHAALEALAARLAARLDNERAFSAHAAHALRTPLAGIDAQLAMALRECAPELHHRLQRVREGAGRLQAVMAALLSLFRVGAEPRRTTVELATLLRWLPTSTLQLHVQPGATVEADADLLAAALVNLIDNAQRHGAAHAWIEVPAPGRIVIRDDGQGVAPERRRRLQAALASQRYDGATGLGLMLADRVARSHAGMLHVLDIDAGFAAALELGAPVAVSTCPPRERTDPGDSACDGTAKASVTPAADEQFTVRRA
jgi:signal transduction histidine kinase